MPHKDPEARKAYQRAYAASHREQLREIKRRWKRNHPEQVRESERIRQCNDGGGYGNRWRNIINPQSARSASLRRDYGIDAEQYDAMLASQNGCCKICLKPQPGKRRLHIDHDHACCPQKRCCGKCIRGLLCWFCNQAIGMMGDSVAVLENAANYLRLHLNSRGIDGYSRVTKSEIQDFSRDARVRLKEAEIRQREESWEQEAGARYCTFGGAEGFGFLDA